MATPPGIADALELIELFTGGDLTHRIAAIEHAVKGCDGRGCQVAGVDAGVTSDLLAAAHVIKRAAGQINTLVHAVGVMLLVPKILEPGEKVEYVSLGAGNTGRTFDLETDRRVAEFKFIYWQGGPETIRKNALFKDFYELAEHVTEKRKELYVLGTHYPLKFLCGGRALKSVMSRNTALARDLRRRYGDRFTTVREYYSYRQNEVKLCDARPLLPELVEIAAAAVGVDAEDVEPTVPKRFDEYISEVLRRAETPLSYQQIADELNRPGGYAKRDGTLVTAAHVRARTHHRDYKHEFIFENGRVRQRG